MTVRVGVVGTSHFTQSLHLPSIASHPRAEITAICGQNRGRADRVAAEYGIPHVFTDHREMVGSGLLDALVVVTPDATHYPITMAALDAGLHVLCEKALAMNAEQAQQMYDTARTAGVITMVNYTWRWVAPFRYLHELVADGYIGSCRHAHFRQQSGGALDSAYAWRSDPDLGQGILADLGSHMIDMARWLVGDVGRVSGHLTSFVEHDGPDRRAFASANDSALVAVEFGRGAQGIICVSGVTHIGDRGLDVRVALYGSDGSLELDLSLVGYHLRGVRHGEGGWRQLSIPAELTEVGSTAPAWGSALFAPFTNQSAGDRLFIDGILEGRQVSPSFYDGYQAQRVIDAVLRSNQEGRWITVTPPPPVSSPPSVREES